MMKISINEQVIKMYNKIEIEHNFEKLVKNVIRDTTLSQQDIINWLINEGYSSYFFCSSYKDLIDDLFQEFKR
jgi:hypothetical protein